MLISTPEILEKNVSATCMFWLSHRLKRVARSSIATESMGLCKAVERGEFLRACFCELTDPAFNFRQWEKCTLKVPLLAATDCRSVYVHISAERGLPRDMILALDLAALRDTFKSQLREGTEGRHARLRWIPGPRNLADGLTKHITIQSLIISVLTEGRYTLAAESTLLESAQKSKKRLKNQDSTQSVLLCLNSSYTWQ